MPSSVIGTGGNYTTIQLWEDDIPASLSSGNVYEGKCKNQNFTAGVTISGQTGENATTYIKLTTDTSASLFDSDSNPLEFDNSAGAAITEAAGYGFVVDAQIDYSVIEKLQVKNTNTGGGIKVTSNCTVQNCLVESDSNSSARAGIENANSAGLIVNCLVFMSGSRSGMVGIYGRCDTIACTVVNPSNYTVQGKGISTSYGRPDVFGCAVYGFGTAFHKAGGSAWAAGCDYNATDDTFAPGTNSIDTQTYSSTSPFVDADSTTNYDLKLATSSYLEAASAQHADTNDLDIFGNARDTSTPDIGCFELQGSGSPAGDVVATSPGSNVVSTGESDFVGSVDTPAAASNVVVTGESDFIAAVTALVAGSSVISTGWGYGAGLPYSQIAKLTAITPENNGKFGYAIAVSSDKSTIAVGCPYEAAGGTERGAVYFFRGATFSTVTRVVLTAVTPANGDHFGWDIDLSYNGDIALVGCPSQNGGGTDQGAGYVLSGSSWATQTELVPDTRNDSFFVGRSVSLSADGTVAVLGAQFDNGAGAQRGAIHVFKDAWATKIKITAGSPTDYDKFGSKVKISPDKSKIAVSAEGKDGGGSNRGGVFVLSGSNYGTEQLISSSINDTDGDALGYGLAISVNGDFVAAGSEFIDVAGSNSGGAAVYSGASYVTEKPVNHSSPNAEDRYGSSLALTYDGKILIGGAYREDGAGLDRGGAFVQSASDYSLITKLIAGDQEDVSFFGWSLGCSAGAEIVCVGAYRENLAGSNQGAAYVFALHDFVVVSSPGSDVTVTGESDFVGSVVNDSPVSNVAVDVDYTSPNTVASVSSPPSVVTVTGAFPFVISGSQSSAASNAAVTVTLSDSVSGDVAGSSPASDVVVQGKADFVGSVANDSTASVVAALGKADFVSSAANVSAASAVVALGKSAFVGSASCAGVGSLAAVIASYVLPTVTCTVDFSSHASTVYATDEPPHYYDLSIKLNDIDGPLVGVLVTAELNKSVLDYGVVVPELVSGLTDANGEVTLSLWSNTFSQEITHYVVEAKSTSETYLRATVVMPAMAANIWDLADIDKESMH